MIEMNKKYRTRDGKPVRVLCVDAKNEEGYTVVALVTSAPGHEGASLFTPDGAFLNNDTEDDWDLVEVGPYEDFKIDEPVMVRDYLDEEWFRRHFAGVNEDGCPLAWLEGKTSFTGDYRVTSWRECRRPTPEELATKP